MCLIYKAGLRNKTANSAYIGVPRVKQIAKVASIFAKKYLPELSRTFLLIGID